MTAHILTITEQPYACLNVKCSCGWAKGFHYNDNIVIPALLRDHVEIQPAATYLAEMGEIAE